MNVNRKEMLIWQPVDKQHNHIDSIHGPTVADPMGFFWVW